MESLLHESPKQLLSSRDESLQLAHNSTRGPKKWQNLNHRPRFERNFRGKKKKKMTTWIIGEQVLLSFSSEYLIQINRSGFHGKKNSCEWTIISTSLYIKRFHVTAFGRFLSRNRSKSSLVLTYVYESKISWRCKRQADSTELHDCSENWFPLLVTNSEQIHNRISRRKPESVAAPVMY